MRFAAALLSLLLLASPVSANEQEEEYKKAFEHMQKDEYDQAIECFENILKVNPNLPPIYNMLGVAYLRQNESIESAIGSFEQAVKLDPTFSEAYFNLATTYAGPGNKPDEAAKYFKKTIEVDPMHAEAHFGLGWYYLIVKQNAEEALALFNKAVEINPEFAQAHYGQGLAYVKLGKQPLALTPISTLRSLNRNDLAKLLEVAVRGEDVSPYGDRPQPGSTPKGGPPQPGEGEAVEKNERAQPGV